MNNFSAIHAIFAPISSIGAAWRKKFKTFNEITKILFHGLAFSEQRPEWGFQAKTPCQTIIHPFQPILISNTLIVSSTSGNTWDHQKFSKLHFTGAIGNCDKKYSIE
jgi:hypothetical protein